MVNGDFRFRGWEQTNGGNEVPGEVICSFTLFTPGSNTVYVCLSAGKSKSEKHC